MTKGKKPAVIYLLHFKDPYGKREVQHYLGCTELNLEERLARHEAGNGAALLRAVIASGGSFKLVATFEGGWEEEKRMKAQKISWAKLCPVCISGRDKQPTGVITR